MLRGTHHSVESRSLMSRVRRGQSLLKPKSGRQRQVAAERFDANWADPDWRAMMRAVRARGATDEMARVQMQERWRDPDWRARMSGVDRTGAVLGECAYCGGQATHWEHVIPRSRGGSDDPSNLVPACRPCNSSKGRMTPDEWLAAGLFVS